MYVTIRFFSLMRITFLYQIGKLAFAVIHSTTIGLPAWRKACEDHQMRARLIPRDVRTRWNSLYDMLSVAVTYKEVINSFTGDRNLGFRNFDLSNAQWTLLEDMLHVLKVRAFTLVDFLLLKVME